MKTFLVMGSILAPLALYLFQKIWMQSRWLFNSIALISALVFGNITAFAIYEIIRNQTVFMTSIHALFLNPFFLLTGSYLGVYFLYRLLLLTWDER